MVHPLAKGRGVQVESVQAVSSLITRGTLRLKSRQDARTRSGLPDPLSQGQSCGKRYPETARVSTMSDPRPTADYDAGCGGCRGIGAHRRYCPRHPDFHPWRQLADRAESIGDSIGGSDPGLANRAYALAGAIRDAMPNHPWFPARVIPPARGEP